MTTHQSVRVLRIVDLVPHSANVRDELDGIEDLARSIKSMGIIEPLVVTEHPSLDGKWLILAGHRRHAAATMAGIASVPCVVRHGADDTVEQLALMLVENMQRRELNPMEKAEAIGALVARGLNQSQIARMIGITPSTVNYYAVLLDLDEESREAVRAGDVAVGDAREFVRATRAERRAMAGKPKRGRPVQVDQRHFKWDHPLAATVRERCAHTTRPKVGKQGCGQCWEDAIRADAVTQAQHAELAAAAGTQVPGQTCLEDHLTDVSA